MKILVGISGGVDSAVAAYLLKKQGYDVIGVTMSVWDKTNPFTSTQGKGCFSPTPQKDIDDVKHICDFLGIDHFVLDCSLAYKKFVFDYFKNEYLSARTPNPCVCCNSAIKFKALPEEAKAQGIVFDKFATGHYARIEQDAQTGRFLLKQGKDLKKDQTYFIYRLMQNQLSNVIFPLGEYTKAQIRDIASEINLPVSTKPDSQDFYAGHYAELFGVEEKKGYFKDVNGKILGTHKGFWNYTVGQRKGLGIAAKEPLYVLRLNAQENEVILAPQKDVLERDLLATNCNFIAIENLTKPMHVHAKVRSTQTPAPAVIYPEHNNCIRVTFDELQKPAASGQSVVFYKDDMVIGGGILEKEKPF